MKSGWLSAAFFAVSLAVSACGGMEEPVEPAQVPEQGQVEQRLYGCDDEGQCGEGWYCDPGWICRREPTLTTQNAPAANSWGGTCQENCAMDCGQRYPDDSYLRSLCTTSCIGYECGGADYP
ncbi:MAG TPA: hypothetical protein VEU33_08335 [Archangium sp.]|nr:hypothetical protein [Archangium sp.]